MCRRNGWDCHGLPVEYEVEKELQISGRKQIEEYGVEKFNEKCRESVFRYTGKWEKLLRELDDGLILMTSMRPSILHIWSRSGGF